MVVRATPSFLPLVRHERVERWPGLWTPFRPSFSGVAPSTVIPGGKAIEHFFALTVDECFPV